MPADVGNQTLSLKYGAPGNSSEVNRRFVDVRPVGIYSGGVLEIVDGTHAKLSSLVCEISDGTHQVRISTTTDVTVLVGSSTPYIILRWSYTGDVSDYMEILAVASGSIVSTDLVVAKCSFGGGVLNGFDYGDSTYPRTFPNTQDFSLKVVPATGMQMYVHPGYYQDNLQSYLIPFQLTDALTAPASDSKVFLVYIDADTGTVEVDASGLAEATPSAPDYNGKLVLAEVTVASTDTSITVDMIRDVRPHVTHGQESVDGTTITRNTAGALKQVDREYIITRAYGAQLQGQSSWTAMTNTGTVIANQTLADPVNGVFTLNAGVFYTLRYNLIFQRVSGTPVFQARFHVLSGDFSWWLADDDFNQSNTKGEIFNSLDSPKHLLGEWIILPSVNTTLRVEVITKDTDNYESRVLSGVISINS
jgi:hypothetical protein